tara:strand:- start:61 stop:966 length:906 start_codon:yes stop_codon:yes gene_type:complete
MGLTAFDSFDENKIVNIDLIPYKKNDIVAYKKRRQLGRYKCQGCFSTLTEVDPYSSISALGKEYEVKNHFRCNNKECVSHYLKKKSRYNNKKKGQTVEEARKDHKEFVEKWITKFDTNCHYLEECIKINEIKTIVIFSRAIISFEIVRKIKADNKNYKIIVILDEGVKNRLITNEPYYNTDGKYNFEIYLPIKNDIKYCLDNDFDVYLDTGEDILLEIKDNNKLNEGFYCKLKEINDFLFSSNINRKQIKYIFRKDYNSYMFDNAKKQYKIQKENEAKAKCMENERMFHLELLKLKRKYSR